MVTWTSKRQVTTACQLCISVKECCLCEMYMYWTYFNVNFKTTNYYSLRTPHCSAGMLVRLYICTFRSLRCFKSPTSRTILWVLELKHDEWPQLANFAVQCRNPVRANLVWKSATRRINFVLSSKGQCRKAVYVKCICTELTATYVVLNVQHVVHYFVISLPYLIMTTYAA